MPGIARHRMIGVLRVSSAELREDSQVRQKLLKADGKEAV